MNCTKAFDTLHVASCILFFKYQNKCNETSICYPKKDLKVYLRYFINNRNLFIYFVAINLLVMAEDIESYKLTYFWKGCDHLMGFKEFVDIRRTETETFLEVSNRGNLFERKFIGSIGDGIVFQRGDIDDFFIFRNMCVLSDEAVWNPSFENRMVLLAEYTSPGYCMLRYIAGPVFSEDLYCLSKAARVYLSSSKFLDKCITFSAGIASSIGPVVVEGCQRSTCTLPVIGWPSIAKDWIKRDRKRCWPNQETLSKVVREGCHCVPVGQRSSSKRNMEWQLSFSVAESTLMQSIDHASFKLYQVLKILIYERLNTTDGCQNIVSSYMVRTLVFWMCEDKLTNFICSENLIHNIQKCLSQLEDWIRHGFVPHYFLPERNLLKEKLRPLQRAKVLERLIMLKSEVLNELFSCPSFKGIKVDVECDPPLAVESLELAPDEMNMRCEFEFFEKVGGVYFSRLQWSRALQMLENFESAYEMDSLSDLQGSIVKQMYYRVANAIGKVAYRVAYNSYSNKKRHSMVCISEAFLRIGCSCDVTSGKLSLASLYFCLNKIRKCLSITDLALCGITPFTVYYRNFERVSSNESRRQQYKDVISSDDLPLSLKMKRACVTDVEIIRTSHLWPEAISMEVEIHPKETRLISVPALIYLHFLRFLCFETANDNIMKMESLSNLSAISYDDEHNDGSFLSYNIIGLCHQRVGQYPEAVDMFCKGAKAGMDLDWMNECLNPGLIRLGIVLNRAFRNSHE